jgi:predicted amidohydrolase YtcJ
VRTVFAAPALVYHHLKPSAITRRKIHSIRMPMTVTTRYPINRHRIVRLNCWPSQKILFSLSGNIGQGGNAVCIVCKESQNSPSRAAATSRRAFLKSTAAMGAIYAAGAVPGAKQALAQRPAKASIVIENAGVITLDPKNPHAEAIAIAGEDILSVGGRRDIEPFIGPETQIIDAGRRTVIPGLNDSHTHFIRGGLTYSQELRWDGVPSLSLALEMLKEQAARTEAPHWVQVVGGWTGAQFREKRLPALDEINAATGDVPAFVMHIYDRAFLNKAAMRVLGFNKDSPDPAGGRFERDATGAPTGAIINVTSIGSLLGIFARIPKLDADAQIASTKHFMRELNRLGITSVIDAGGGGQNYPANYQAIAKLAANKELTVRTGYSLFAQRPGKELDDYKDWVNQVKPGQGDAYFRMTGAGEYMVWAMHDPANFAKDVIAPQPVSETQLVEAIKLVSSHGWPFRLHANYDATARNLMRAIETAHRDVPVDKLRWSIDHGEGLTAPTLERIAKLGGAVAIQNRMTLDGDAYAGKWGRSAAEDAPPVGLIRQMGVPLAAGTDGNRASSHNPWAGIEWLVTGRSAGGTQLNADRNLVSRQEALRLYSSAGAWLTSEEDKKGILRPGAWADLAILSDNFMTVPAGEISRLSSVLTLVGGRPVYGAGEFSPLAPKPLPVVPDWLPIGSYPSYRTTARGAPDGQTLLADYLAGTELPDLIAPEGKRWTMGCLCGLL